MPGNRLTPEEREEISRGVARGQPFAEIARSLGRPTSTVSREVARNGGRFGYRSWHAQRRAKRQCRRHRRTKLYENPALRFAVIAGLEQNWSPEQISARLRAEHPDDPRWWVSHETIYRTLYLQGRGALRKELANALRTGRAQRVPRGSRSHTRGRIPGMVMIADRPAEVDERVVPGHWEGDLIIGAHHDSAIATLVERTTRFVMLVHLPKSKGAGAVADALVAKMIELPVQLRRSLTWDQGSEMAHHARITIDTGLQVFFCDPHSPWQRGTNENTNGLLRQYFPKGTDLSRYGAAELDVVSDELNRRPRKTLGWMTPSEKLAELVAMVT